MEQPTRKKRKRSAVALAQESDHDDGELSSSSDVSSECKAEVTKYDGAVDGHGQMHGRGTATYEDGTVYEGRFSHGVLHGKGTLRFPDGGALHGTFRHGVLQGLGSLVDEVGNELKGHFVDGLLNGRGTETRADGKVVFEGMFQDNVRHGPGEWYLVDGGRYIGMFKDGELHGDDIQYRFSPHFRYGLKGVCRDGHMQSAAFHKDISGAEKSCSDENAYSKDSVLYCYDRPTATRLQQQPLLRDPYESMVVYVAASTMDGAGEGLFAKCDIPKDCVVSFYSGIIIPQAEVDARSWLLNSNTIALIEEEETVIDVPLEMSTESAYCASLGHKANHSSDPNAKYWLFDHPRFGLIKSVRTIRAVKKGEEITVDYGYTNEMPDWYAKTYGPKNASS